MLIIISTIIALIGTALLILVSIATSKNPSWYCWMLIIIGVAVDIVAIIGIFSSGPAMQGKRCMLFFFFYCIFILMFATAFFSALCFVSPQFLVDLVMHALATFKELFPPDRFPEFYTGDDVTFAVLVASWLAQYGFYAGIVAAVLAGLLFFTLLFTTIILSFERVFRSLLSIQNFLTMGLGAGAIAIGIYSLVTGKAVISAYSWMPIVLIVVGSFVVVLSLLGCVGACCKSRCSVVIYVVILGVIILATAALAIAVFVFRSQLITYITDHIDQLREYFPEYQDLSVEDFKILISAFFESNLTIVAAGSILFGIFLLWTFFASVYLLVRWSSLVTTSVTQVDLPTYTTFGRSSFDGKQPTQTHF